MGFRFATGFPVRGGDRPSAYGSLSVRKRRSGQVRSIVEIAVRVVFPAIPHGGGLAHIGGGDDYAIPLDLRSNGMPPSQTLDAMAEVTAANRQNRRELRTIRE